MSPFRPRLQDPDASLDLAMAADLEMMLPLIWIEPVAAAALQPPEAPAAPPEAPGPLAPGLQLAQRGDGPAAIGETSGAGLSTAAPPANAAPEGDATQATTAPEGDATQSIHDGMAEAPPASGDGAEVPSSPDGEAMLTAYLEALAPTLAEFAVAIASLAPPPEGMALPEMPTLPEPWMLG